MTYLTITADATSEFRDRGSRFLGFARPISGTDDFKQFLAALKKDHPKAAHHCFAYRVGTDGNQFRASDDGEPSGTAGKPILGQIDSRKLTDIVVVVVRYFGGTLLGVPGLINAYKTTASYVLDAASIIEKLVRVDYILEFDISQLNDAMRVIKKFDCEIRIQEILLFCKMIIGVPKQVEENFQKAVSEIHAITVTQSTNAGE